MLDLFWIFNHTNYMYMYSLAHLFYVTEIHIHQRSAYDVRLSLLFCNGELADSRPILFNRGYKSFKIVLIFFHIYSTLIWMRILLVFFFHYDSFNCINQTYCNKTFRILKSSWIDFILCSPRQSRGSLCYCEKWLCHKQKLTLKRLNKKASIIKLQ